MWSAQERTSHINLSSNECSHPDLSKQITGEREAQMSGNSAVVSYINRHEATMTLSLHAGT